MTPELLRDVEALCDAVAGGVWRAGVTVHCCALCQEPQANQPAQTHKPVCPVLLARRIREEMKADV